MDLPQSERSHKMAAEEPPRMDWSRWQPNMGGFHRLAYIVGGPLMMAFGFWYAESNWAKVLFPIMGAGTLISGLISFCSTKAILSSLFRTR